MVVVSKMKPVDWIKNRIFSGSYAMKKQLRIALDAVLRPMGDRYFGHGNSFVYPIYPYPSHTLYDISYHSDVLTTIHNSLRRELFRNGIDLSKAESEEDETISEQEVVPQGKTKKEILEFLENVNSNSQSLLDVCMEIEDDFSIIDDGFMVFIFDYILDSNGKLKSKELREILRGDPKYMGLVMDKYDRFGYDDDGNELSACIAHRTELLENKDRCPLCGDETFKVHFFSESDDGKIFYFKDEVVYKNKYRPSRRRGFSPVFSVWQKVRTLFFMDKYMMEMYDRQRPPKAGLFFKTSNQAGLMRAWDEAKQKVQENPHLPITMGIPDSTNGQDFVKFIDFMKSLDEMQYTEARNEMRRQMGAVYGVEPIFQGDISTSGGLNNEGLQIAVTNRASEYGQSIYNKHYFPKVLEAFGAQGWIIILNPSEEQDDMSRLQRQAQSLQNGQLALEIGLTARYDTDVGEVVIEDGLLERQEVITPPDMGFPTQFSEGETMSGLPETPKSVSKVGKRRTPFTKLEKALEKEINAFLNKFKIKPNKKELEAEIKRIKKGLEKELKGAQEKHFAETYERGINQVNRDLGTSFSFGKPDAEALKVLNNQKVLRDAYVGLAADVSNKMNDVIREAFEKPEKLRIDTIKEGLKETADLTDFRAETIARTETGKVASAARHNNYRKDSRFDTFKFKHIGPSDGRTTSTSKRIKARTAKGVSWKRYVNIVAEESKKDFPEWIVNKDFPLSHYNSRHTFVRIVN